MKNKKKLLTKQKNFIFMKNFDLKACGVSEISEGEMREINGGNIGVIVRVIWKIVEVAGGALILSEFVDGFIEGFKEGYNS
jgi:hypothetical protein